jgi:asparagine synthetase B (glutamine-hydrolysing)
MALKVKNVAAGFWSGGSFIPIRASGDYDGNAPKLVKKSTASTDRSKKGYKVVRRKVKGKIKEFRVPLKKKGAIKASDLATPHKRTKGLGKDVLKVAARAKARKLAASKAKAAATRAAKKAAPKKATKKAVKKTVSKKRNPIPTTFTDAKVRRTPGGDFQILLLK